MGKKHIPKFPPNKIKRMIQENEEIGKICHLIPPVIGRSLQLFIDQIAERLIAAVTKYDLNKITMPALQKTALEQSSFGFMKDTLDHVDNLDTAKRLRRKRANSEEQMEVFIKLFKKSDQQ